VFQALEQAAGQCEVPCARIERTTVQIFADLLAGISSMQNPQPYINRSEMESCLRIVQCTANKFENKDVLGFQEVAVRGTEHKTGGCIHNPHIEFSGAHNAAGP